MYYWCVRCVRHLTEITNNVLFISSHCDGIRTYLNNRINQWLKYGRINSGMIIMHVIDSKCICIFASNIDERGYWLAHCGLVMPHGDIKLGTRVFACCLTAPSHYLINCWHSISGVLWHASHKCSGMQFVAWTRKLHYNNNCHNPRGHCVKVTWHEIVTSSNVATPICNHFHWSSKIWPKPRFTLFKCYCRI